MSPSFLLLQVTLIKQEKVACLAGVEGNRANGRYCSVSRLPRV